MAPHGRIIGCRIDPVAYIDDYDLYLHAVAYVVSNDAVRRFRPQRCTNTGRQWMMRW